MSGDGLDKLMQSLAELLTEINDHIVVEGHVFPTSHSDPITAANSAAESAGRKPIDGAWRELLTESPIDALAYRVGHDLAHPSHQCFSADKCRKLAESLASHADPASRWYTNNSEVCIGPNGSSSYSSTPMTGWTLDAAFVVVGAQNTLFLCFMAED
jgi:hypothetical protein